MLEKLAIALFRYNIGVGTIEWMMILRLFRKVSKEQYNETVAWAKKLLKGQHLTEEA